MSRSILSLAVVFLIAATPAAARQDLARNADGLGARLRGHYQMIEPVTDGVHMIRQIEPFQVSVLGNIGVVEQSDGLVLFDAGADPATTRRALRLIATVSPKPVKAVVISHWHSDHHGGLVEIVERWPAVRIIATATTARNLAEFATGLPTRIDTAGEPDTFANALQGVAAIREAQTRSSHLPDIVRGYDDLIALSLMTARDNEGARLALPTETFTDRLLLDDPVAPIELMFLGAANTTGEAVAWLPRQSVLFTGDVVVAPFPYGIAAHPNGWRGVLAKIDAMDFAALVPGHGELQRDHDYLRRMDAALAEAIAAVTPLVREGRSLDEIRALVTLPAQADAFAGSDPWRRKWFYRYWLHPLIGCIAVEARGETVTYPAGSATCSGAGSLGL